MTTPRTSFVWLALGGALALVGGGSRAASADIGFDLQLPGDDQIVAAAADQESPWITAGDDGYLAVWADHRSTPPGQYFEFETSMDIYGQRLDAAGAPLEPTPFVITQARASQERPRAAWNGSEWLVVFESYDLSGTGFYYEKTLAGVRVAADGAVLDPEPRRYFNAVPSGDSWAVASDGIGWMVVFQTDAIKALPVAADGSIDQPPLILVPSTFFLRFNLRLASAGGIFLLTWDEQAVPFGLRIDRHGVPLDPQPFPVGPGSTIYGLAGRDAGFYAVWHKQAAVTGSRIDLAGTLLDAPGVKISGSNPPSGVGTRVTWDGSDWRVTWGQSAGARIATVSSSGQVQNPGGALIAGAAAGETAASGGDVEMVWSQFADNQYDVLGVHVDAAQSSDPPITLSVGAPLQYRVDVAAGADGYMMVFRSLDAATFALEGMPLDASGAALLAQPFLIDVGSATTGPGTPSVAWNGSLYLVSWGRGGKIWARRFAADGGAVDPAPVAVMDGFGPTDTAALGGDFLVAARRYGFNFEIINPVAARVRGADGVVLDPGGLVVGWSYATSIAAAAFDDRWLVVWQRNFTHDDSLATTLGAFVEANGALNPQFEIHGVFSTAGGNAYFEVALASSGEDALMVQSQELTSGVETDLLAHVVHADGTVEPAVNLTPWAGNQYGPRVAWDGSRYVVTYHEQRTRFAPHTLSFLDARADLFGMRVSAAGEVIDPLGFALSASAGAEAYPNLTAAGGTTLAAGSVMAGPPLAAYRIGYELLGAGGNQWPIAVATADVEAGDVPLTVVFDAAGSEDPDGVLTGWQWDLGDGSTASGPIAVHTYMQPGKYVASLTVTDDGGATTANVVPIDAAAPNLPPVAVAVAQPTSGPAPLEVTFFGEGSYDPDGSIGNYQWTFSQGGTYWGKTAFNTFTTEGEHWAKLTVYDALGATGTITLPILVGEIVLDAPTDLRLTAKSRLVNGKPKARVQLRWLDHAAGEEAYEVERCTGSGCASYALIGTVGPNVTLFFDTTAAVGETYSYRVRATAGGEVSGYSNVATVTVPAP